MHDLFGIVYMGQGSAPQNHFSASSAKIIRTVPWAKIVTDYEGVFHWVNFPRILKKAEVGLISTSHFFVIPPDQDIIAQQFLSFEETFHEDLSKTIVFWPCRDVNDGYTRMGGIVLFPKELIGQCLDTPEAYKKAGYEFRFENFAQTEHVGYDIFYQHVPGHQREVRHNGLKYKQINGITTSVLNDRNDALMEAARRSTTTHFWMVPGFTDVHPNNLGRMIDPECVDPRQSPIFHTSVTNRFGDKFQHGPMLIPTSYRSNHFRDGTTYRRAMHDHGDLGFMPPGIELQGQYDIAMLTFNETHADEHFERLSNHTEQRAFRVDGVVGIRQAHEEACRRVLTEYFWVVDGDNLIDPDFKFDFVVPIYEEEAIYVWRARNNVNGLIYGNGGIKLFPTRIVRSILGDIGYLDYTGMIARRCGGMRVREQIASTTVIDGTPYEAWRSGFREAYKLNLAAQTGDTVATERLAIWTSVSHTENGRFTVEGAKAAVSCVDDPMVMMNIINDHQRMKEMFDEIYG